MNTTVTLCSTGARGVMVSTEFFYTRGPGFKATADLFFYTLRFKANTFCSPYVSSLSGRKAPVVRKAERFFRRRLGFCPGVNRPQSGGIQFGRRPNVLLAVGELFSGCEAPVVRREAPVLLPAVGGFQFGRNPNILFARNRSGNVRVRRKRIISKLFVTLSFPYPRTKPIMFCFTDNFRDWLIRW